MRIPRVSLVIAFAALLGGCYKYVPVEPSAVTPGAGVRARLSDAGAEEMRRLFGPDVLSVEGPLVAWNGGGLSLLWETYLRRQGYPPTTVTDTIRLEATSPWVVYRVFQKSIPPNRSRERSTPTPAPS